jgi:DNA polymerase-3 subunit delta'
VLNLGHPDVHWFVPIQRPKAGEPDKQVDEAAETLGEIMEERRRKPLWGPSDGMWAHGVPSARLLLKRAMLTPMEAKKKVFIVGNAERLIAQIGTEDAPNALLKVLEEPPADTQFLLTAADPRRLLPTIRSRSIIVRLGRLSDGEVREFLTTHAGLTAKVAAERAATAEGSIGAALGEDGSAARHRDAAVSVIDALVGGDGRQFERALSQPPYQARGDFAAMLDALSQLLADAAREGTGGRATRPVPKALKGRPVAGLAAASEMVMAAREAAQGNVNPQLLLAALALDLEEALCV